MNRPLLDLTQCRTVRAVGAAMRTAQVCEVCRLDFATRLDPPVCDSCYGFVFAPWPSVAPPTRRELRATA